MKRLFDMKWLALIFLQILLMMLIFLKQEAPAPHENDFNVLKEHLSHLQKNKPDLSPITEPLNALKTVIDELKETNNNRLNEITTLDELAIQKKLDQLTTLLLNLDDKKNPVKMLPKSALPFTVQSIDSLQDIFIVSLLYHYESISLEKGDELSGWKVLQIDFKNQKVEFENTDKAHVLIQLTREDEQHA